MSHDFRPTIHKIFQQGRDKGTVISVEDSLNQNKLKFTGTSFGKGVSRDYVYCNLDFDEVLMLSHLILSGTFSKILPPKEPSSFEAGRQGTYHVAGEYTAYKGSRKSEQYNGQPESRIIEIRAIAAVKVLKPAVAADPENGIEAKPAVTQTTPKYSISMWFGPGKLTDTGAIMPSVGRSQMVSQRMYIDAAEMIRMMLKCQLHINSYYADHYPKMYNPADGSIIKGFRNDIFSDPNAPRFKPESSQEDLEQSYTPPAQEEEPKSPDALDI